MVHVFKDSERNRCMMRACGKLEEFVQMTMSTCGLHHGITLRAHVGRNTTLIQIMRSQILHVIMDDDSAIWIVQTIRRFCQRRTTIRQRTRDDVVVLVNLLVVIGKVSFVFFNALGVRHLNIVVFEGNIVEVQSHICIAVHTDGLIVSDQSISHVFRTRTYPCFRVSVLE